jgi:hypothetical protein
MNNEFGQNHAKDSFSLVQKLLSQKSELRFKNLDQALEIDCLKSQLDSEKFLVNYYKALVTNMMAEEISQCCL